MIGFAEINKLTVADSAELLLSQWEAQPYSELSVILSWSRALLAVHQSHHWQASADPFYGDHLLFDRVYEGVSADVDRIAEKAVGMGTMELVCPCKISQQVCSILSTLYKFRPGIPQPSDLVCRSLHMERCFLETISLMRASLESKGALTLGVDNMLADLSDKHEGHVFLLKQRNGGV